MVYLTYYKYDENKCYINFRDIAKRNCYIIDTGIMSKNIYGTIQKDIIYVKNSKKLLTIVSY